ncbi:MAG: T9SS type A sorting domain-containing protein [Bacteroidetes bacterium]|nr:T9SS type A sorting domain-containing protein [Bacteroidota bacterium]
MKSSNVSLKRASSAPIATFVVVLLFGILVYNPAWAQQILAGPDGYSACAIDANGNLYTWGIDQYFHTVVSTTSGNAQDLTPVQVGFPSGVTAWTSASVGYLFTLAIGNDGNIYAWGLNTYGQLGDSTTTNSDVPVLVKLPNGVTAKAVSAGTSFGMAIGSDGNVYAWGLNSSGELGDSTTTNSTVPVKVTLPGGVLAKSIFAAPAFGLAIGSDGNLYAWGSNSTGQLGDSTTVTSNVPVRVRLPIGVTAIAISAGSSYSLAIGSDGNVYAWGGNGFGQLGNGTKTNSSIPVMVKMPSGVIGKAIAGGRLHSLAIGSDGKVYAWGSNVYGELGSGTVNVPSTDSLPVAVGLPGGLTATGVTAIRWSTYVIGSNDSVYAWGYNQEGELGVGVKTGGPKYGIAAPTTVPDLILALPQVPTLLSPVNGAAKQPTAIVLKWSESPHAISYQCQLSLDPTFGANFIVVDSSMTDTSDTVSGLAAGMVYYWHVRSLNDGILSAFSPVDSFTTITTGPAKPVLALPSTSETGVPRLTMFEWDSSSSATRYYLQIATSDQIYISGDSVGEFLSQNVVFDTTVTDTSVRLPSPLVATTKYYWHVAGIDSAGMGGFSVSSAFTTGSGLLAVKTLEGTPKEFALMQNYPNPFNPTTIIRYSLPKAQMVTLNVYDVLGQEVATLVNARQNAGYYEVNFNADRLASGIYFYVLRTDKFTSAHKMLLLK